MQGLQLRNRFALLRPYFAYPGGHAPIPYGVRGFWEFSSQNVNVPRLAAFPLHQPKFVSPDSISC